MWVFLLGLKGSDLATVPTLLKSLAGCKIKREYEGPVSWVPNPPRRFKYWYLHKHGATTETRHITVRKQLTGLGAVFAAQ